MRPTTRDAVVSPRTRQSSMQRSRVTASTKRGNSSSVASGVATRPVCHRRPGSSMRWRMTVRPSVRAEPDMGTEMIGDSHGRTGSSCTTAADVAVIIDPGTARAAARQRCMSEGGSVECRMTPAKTCTSSPASRRRWSAHWSTPARAACSTVTSPSWGRAIRRSRASMSNDESIDTPSQTGVTRCRLIGVACNGVRSELRTARDASRIRSHGCSTLPTRTT